jgi:hypothetical protein
MIKILKLCAVFLSIIAMPQQTFGSEAKVDTSAERVPEEKPLEVAVAAPSLIDQVRAFQQVNPKKYNIRNGCINTGRIKRIKFLDDRTAMISMFDKKKAIMRLSSNCPGIKRRGFAQISVGRRLCTKSSSFTVLGNTFSCRIGSIEPYIELEDPPEQEKSD